MQRILIVRHPADPFEHAPYVIRVMADEWRRRAFRVDVTSDLGAPVGNDVVVVPHLDLTRTPPKYQKFFAACPVVVNRNVHDISKRRVSRNLVTRTDGYDGPVIVKTNRNAGGDPEKNKLRDRGRLGRAMLKVSRRLPWTVNGLLDPGDYKIFHHPWCVPWPVWHNPRLVVERFLPERQGDLYCLRQYTFFGSREINTMAMAPDPLVKSWNVVRREVLPETPPALRAERRKLGFDYGKFDYVIRDGRVELFDANRTPTYNAASAAGSPSRLLLDLASGIEAFTAIAGDNPAVAADAA